MKVLKKILGVLYNPFNTLSLERANNKTTEFFLRHPILIFFVAVIITALVMGCGYHYLRYISTK